MSFLKKSLQKRIQELRHSIEAQTTELAAYEQVLALETGTLTTLSPAPAAVAAVVKKHSTAQHASQKTAKKVVNPPRLPLLSLLVNSMAAVQTLSLPC